MGKQYKSIEAMIKDSDADKGFKEKALCKIESRKLSKFLVVLRNGHGLTQKQMAEKIGCSQSRILKIETSTDADLTVKDLMDYGKVLNLSAYQK